MDTQEAGAEGTQEKSDTGAPPERPNPQSIVDRVRAKAAEAAKSAAVAQAQATKDGAKGDEDDDGKGGDEGEGDEEAQTPAEVRLATLQKRLAEVSAKVEAAEKAAARGLAEFEERLKKNPARVLKEKLGDKAWEALAADFEAMETPGVAAATEAEARLAKRVAELEDQVKKDNAARDEARREEIQRAADERGLALLSENAEKFPIASRKENAKEAIKQAQARAIKVARRIATTRQEAGDERPITEKHAKKLLLKALGKVEAKLAERGQRYAPPEQRQRRGITSAPSLGAARQLGAPAIDSKAPLSEKKRELLDRLRRAAQRPST